MDMGLQYYIDSSLPTSMASDLIVWLERVAERCPSDALLSICLLSAGGKLCMDISLFSATMQLKEKIECKSYEAIKKRLERLFNSRLSRWRSSVAA